MLQCGKGGDAYSRLAFIEPPPCYPLSAWKGAAQKHEDPGSSVLYNINHQRPLNISGSLKPERGDTTEVLSSEGESGDDTQSEGSTPTKRKFKPIPKPKGKRPAQPLPGDPSVSSTTPSPTGKSAKSRKQPEQTVPTSQPSPGGDDEEREKKPKKTKSPGSLDKLRKALHKE